MKTKEGYTANEGKKILVLKRNKRCKGFALLTRCTRLHTWADAGDFFSAVEERGLKLSEMGFKGEPSAFLSLRWLQPARHNTHTHKIRMS